MRLLYLNTLLAFILLASLANADGFPPITQQSYDAMTSAAPARAAVKPKQPRKLLVYTHAQGYVHESIPYAAFALKEMGRKTGAFEATISDDPASFDAESLAKYDAVVLDSTTSDFLIPSLVEQKQKKITTDTMIQYRAFGLKRRQALLDYVRSGHGLIGFHAATDAMGDWPEFGLMIGGYFNGHPWSNEPVWVKVTDPDSPLVAGLDKNFQITDEMYQFKDPYSLDNVHQLLALDTTKTNMKKDGIARKDDDFAVAWIRREGKGRVFYSSMGHYPHIWWDSRIMQFYLNGIQYALGDLEAKDRPTYFQSDNDSITNKPAIIKRKNE